MTLPNQKTTPATSRRQSVSDLKRHLILEAAQRVFERESLEKASMRAIAKEAGYTAATLYFYFSSKEEIYGQLLGQSLERLYQAIEAASSGERGCVRLKAKAFALYDYYDQNPQELALGFYLTGGVRLAGLTPQLNKELNTALRNVLGLLEPEFITLGISDEQAPRSVANLFSYIVGLLIMQHTGRIRIFQLEARELFGEYLEEVIKGHVERNSSQRDSEK